ncbi:hypothetical protein CLOM_g8743 [Closterium sp. NIES-68]|nr:hypothetical protein CLOM_g8743 [Closterium sp. NIES-68]GJP64770.1 hypothetical protein CLOP_g21718 [Closterium sp. NIES-67]
MVTGGGDYCTGESHWVWSFLCGAAEAKALNRTLVVPARRCISAAHSLTGKKEEKPMGLYYNMGHMMSRQPMMYETEFKQRFGSMDPEKLQGTGSTGSTGSMSVEEFKVWGATEWVRERTRDVTLVVRRLREEQFAYQICGVPENKEVLKRDHSLLWRPPALSKLSSNISASMGWDYDAVHVRRGDKVKPSNRRYWPNLDQDTQPHALKKTLPKFIQPGRHVYIASNERTPGFFSPLASLYKIHVLSDYRHLWGPGSQFRRDFRTLLRSLNETTIKPEMDAYMEWIVEATVIANAKKRVETFNDLTNDSKNAMIRHNTTEASS